MINAKIERRVYFEMKKYVIHCLMGAIKKQNAYTNEQLEVIQYGLESIYILITKLLFITFLAYLLGMLYEYFVFLLIYNLIRMPSFGLHATKSWICLVTSSLVFLIMPVIAKYLILPIYIKSIMGAIALLLVYKNAPADTEKRPIVNATRRLTYKYISVFVAFILLMSSLILPNIFIGNSCFWVIIVQCFMISPTIYELFGLPHDNYLNYPKTLNMG